MTEYAVYKSRGESWVELYRCNDPADTADYLQEKISAGYVSNEFFSNGVSFIMADGTAYTMTEEAE